MAMRVEQVGTTINIYCADGHLITSGALRLQAMLVALAETVGCQDAAHRPAVTARS